MVSYRGLTISWQNLGWSGNSEIPDRLGFSWDMKTRLKKSTEGLSRTNLKGQSTTACGYCLIKAFSHSLDRDAKCWLVVRNPVVNHDCFKTIACILQPYNIRVAHKPITTLRQLLTNIKDKDKPKDRQGAVYKIKCCDCQATYMGETGRNLNVRLTKHRRAMRNGDLNNNIVEHHLQPNYIIDSAECVTHSTNYYQQIVLQRWLTNLKQTPLNCCLQLPAPYKQLVDDINNSQTTDWPTTHVQTLHQQKDQNTPITVYSTTDKQ